jgi:septum formation protein
LPAKRFILASSSPRRQSLLADAGYAFDIDPADVDENDYPPSRLPAQVAQHLAERKAKIVSARRPDEVILAADTVVAFGDQPIGKPTDPADAARILRLLSGTTHLCITGVCVTHQSANFLKSTRIMSAVQMRFLSAAQIEQYVARKQWEGKAGGYGIQDPDPFVIRLAGCKTNIVGLPMTTTQALLAEAGIT